MRKKAQFQMSGFKAHEGDESWKKGVGGGVAISPRMIKAIMDGSASNVITTPRPDPSSKAKAQRQPRPGSLRSRRS
ncbi:MAG: hypothetical protein NVS1B6_13870 [Steroidobacteraceae bacterium]